ncbi:hypothetical protein VTO42DRAFT_4084 [Malbranchea cinnamomea]
MVVHRPMSYAGMHGERSRRVQRGTRIRLSLHPSLAAAHVAHAPGSFCARAVSALGRFATQPQALRQSEGRGAARQGGAGGRTAPRGHRRHMLPWTSPERRKSQQDSRRDIMESPLRVESITFAVGDGTRKPAHLTRHSEVAVGSGCPSSTVMSRIGSPHWPLDGFECCSSSPCRHHGEQNREGLMAH